MQFIVMMSNNTRSTKHYEVLQPFKFNFKHQTASLQCKCRCSTSDLHAINYSCSLQCPVVIVPTKYFTTPTVLFKELGISTVIWANHNSRASVRAMQNTCHQIMSEQSLVNIEGKVS